MTNNRLTPKEKREIISKYITGNYNCVKLGKEYNKTKGGILRFLKKNNIPILNNKSILFRRYTINENFFDNIDAEEKAYFLGFLYADGYHNETGHQIVLSLQERDKEILEKLNKIIGSNRPLKLINMKKYNIKKQNQYRLCISNIYISKQLKKIGCVQKKSDKIRIPNNNILPHNLLKHFIRGFFDGDGHVGYYITFHRSKNKRFYTCISCCNIVCNSFFQEEFINLCKKELEIENIKIYNANSDKVKSVRISQLKDIIKFLDWIYKDTKIFLSRKYDKYLFIKKYFNAEDKQKFLKENLVSGR